MLSPAGKEAALYWSPRLYIVLKNGSNWMMRSIIWNLFRFFLAGFFNSCVSASRHELLPLA